MRFFNQSERPLDFSLGEKRRTAPAFGEVTPEIEDKFAWAVKTYGLPLATTPCEPPPHWAPEPEAKKGKGSGKEKGKGGKDGKDGDADAKAKAAAEKAEAEAKAAAELEVREALVEELCAMAELAGQTVTESDRASLMAMTADQLTELKSEIEKSMAAKAEAEAKAAAEAKAKSDKS